MEKLLELIESIRTGFINPLIIAGLSIVLVTSLYGAFRQASKALTSSSGQGSQTLQTTAPIAGTYALLMLFVALIAGLAIAIILWPEVAYGIVNEIWCDLGTGCD
jgi:hypothetical protein